MPRPHLARIVHAPAHVRRLRSPLALPLFAALLTGCPANPIHPPAEPAPTASPIPTTPPTPEVVEYAVPTPRPEGPRLELHPAPGVVRGKLHLTAHAADPHIVAALRFTEPASLRGLRPRHRIADDGHHATLDAIIDTVALPDGPLRVTVEALDRHGRRNHRTMTYTVANIGPAITWDAPPAGAVVRGVVDLAAAARDPDGVAELALEGPDAPRDLDPTRAVVRLRLDTGALPDGPRLFVLRARDTHGNVAYSRRRLVIDNHPTVALDGSAHFGGPVIGARVRAFEWGLWGDEGRRADLCPATGCVSGEGGRFSLPLRDGVDGPIRVLVDRAPGLPTVYGDPLGRGLVDWPQTARLSALLPHPAAQAEPVAVHGVTSLADALATGWRRRGEAPAEAIALADALLAEHLCAHCPLTATAPLPVAHARGHLRLDGPARLGWVHAGLTALAERLADEADRRGAPLRTADPLTLLSHLRRDLGDGLLDGRDVDGARFDPAITPQTLRIRLAVGIADALARLPGALLVPPGALRGPAGWLDALAARVSPLWPDDAPPTPLDETPPRVRIDTPAPDSPHGGELIRLVAHGEDESGPPRLYVVAPDGFAVRVEDDTPGQLVATLDPSGRPVGPATLRVLAEDAAGHLSEAEVTVQIDHHPPRLVVEDLDGRPLDGAERFTRLSTYVMTARVDDPDAVLDAGPDAVIWPLDGRFVIQSSGYQPGPNRVRITARDPAGNRAEVEFGLHYEARGPQIRLMPSSYLPPSGWHLITGGCAPVADDPDGPLVCDIWPRMRPEGFAPVGVRDMEIGATPTIELAPFDPGLGTRAALTIQVWDDTGREQLEYRGLRADGTAGPWVPVPRRAPDHRDHLLPLDTLPPGVPADDPALPVVSVQLRALDHAGNITSRTVRWQRRIVAPPLWWGEDARFAERPGPASPGGYGFHGEDRPLPDLFDPRNAGLRSGLRLARWRVHNPWPVPLRLTVEGRVELAHTRSHGWRIDRRIVTADAPCPPGTFYRAFPDWQSPVSGCAAHFGAVAASGERLVQQVDLPVSPAVERPGDRFLADAIGPGGLVLQPGGTATVVLTVPVTPLDLLPGHEVAVPEPEALHHVLPGMAMIAHTTRVDRDAAVRWSMSGVRGVVTPVGDAPGIEPTAWHVVPDAVIERINPPLQPPQGFESR